MATNKRRQDEKHLKMLRDMVALSQNKQCFDCHQRGPTYVNMTTGSYVCTSCSGILRGLNPPHRVKSISMASFTADEMELLKCHGNDFCKKVWLGLYDPRSGQEYDSREEYKVKDFMIQKYERKRWHVSPTDALKEEARRLNESAFNKQITTKPLRSLLGENAPKLVVQNSQNNSKTQSPSLPNPVASQVTSTQPQQLQLHQNLTLAQQAQQAQQVQQQQQQQQQQQSQINRIHLPNPTSSATFDLLGELGNDPFASTPPSSNASSGGGFADFSQFSSQSSTPTGSNAFSPTSSAPLQPLGLGGPSTVSNGGFANFPPSSTVSTLSNPHPTSNQSTDKYAALADLCSVFSDNGSSGAGSAVSTTAQSSWNVSTNPNNAAHAINWGGGLNTPPSTTTGVNSAMTANSAGGFAFGNVPTTSGAQMDWNTQVGAANASNNMNWGAPVGVTASQTAFGNAVPNPFGTSVFSQAPVGGGGNPFAIGTPAGGNGGNGNNSLFSNQVQPTTNAGFNQFGMQNGSFNAMSPATSAGFGIPQQSVQTFGVPQQSMQAFAPPGQMDKFSGFATHPAAQAFGSGWAPNSVPSANPFMSAATQQQVPPRSSSTNPFL